VSKCSQYLSTLVDRVFSGATSPDKLKSRIGELERRESTWGSAYWGTRRLAENLRKVNPGMSPHSEPNTVIGAAMSAIDELAAARVELRHLRQLDTERRGL
jgi:hypothetical protein